MNFLQNPQKIFEQGMFSIDQNATPEMLERRRQMIRGLISQPSARYTGEGLARLATGVVAGVQNSRMNAHEGEQTAEATSAFNDLFGGNSATPEQDAPRQQNGFQSLFRRAMNNGETPATPTDVTSAADALTPPHVDSQPLPSAPSNMSNDASSIYQGLIGRGLAPHVAEGFVMNFQDESGLNPSIVEAVPNVHGTRGRGLYQLTGSRRDAFEARYGDDYSVDNQLDFLVHELGSTESRAAERINATTNAGEAGAAIVSDFLRPAEQHRRERSARYLSGGGVLSGGVSNPIAGGQQGNQPSMEELVQLAGNPWLNSQQRSVVSAMLGQQQSQQAQANDPLRQLQIQQAQLNLQQDLTGEGASAPTVQSSVPLDDGTTVMVMNDGTRRVMSPTGDILEGSAAADAIRSAREYTVQNQTEIANGRRTGTLNADIELGGQAAAVEDIAEASVSAGIGAWESYGRLQTSLTNIDNAIAAIDDGAQSGIIYNMLPSITEASASLENAMNRMGLDVVGAVTFGALSEGELRLAMETAVPQNLQPEELREWLVKRRDAQQKAAAMAADAAQFLTEPGNTINDWIARNTGQITAQASIPDVFAGHSQVAESAAAQGITVEELWGRMSEEQKSAWLN